MKSVSVSKVVPSPEVKKMNVDFEEALDIAGSGKYQILHCLVMVLSVASSLFEILAYSYVIPAAACDLYLPNNIRGLITSIPNIGIILTAPFWGRVADKHGRKYTLLGTCACAGFFCFLAAFMPNLLGFAICKFIASLFLSAPTSLGYAYAGEVTPKRRRDLAVLCVNGILTISTTFASLLAWAVLAKDWTVGLGVIAFRPWRLLTIVYALLLIITAITITFVQESPKFLMSKGKHREALEVLRYIYSKNTGLSQDDYYVVSLKAASDDGSIESESYMEENKDKNSSALALLRTPHLKWFCLLAFLMFGLCTSLNGLMMFAADVTNKVLAGGDGTLCEILNEQKNQTSTTECDPSISDQTFLIMSVTTFVYGLVVMGGSVCPLPKKTLLVIMYIATGLACMVTGITSNMVVAGILISALQVTALGIGLLSAYAVQLFPTNLRGTAIGAVMMFGRLGSAVGANIAGVMLSVACIATFYAYAGLLFLCAGLSFLLPKNKVEPSNNSLVQNTDQEHT